MATKKKRSKKGLRGAPRQLGTRGLSGSPLAHLHQGRVDLRTLTTPTTCEMALDNLETTAHAEREFSWFPTRKGKDANLRADRAAAQRANREARADVKRLCGCKR